MPNYSLTCADCGRQMVQVSRSLPQGQACCQECRRSHKAEERERSGYIAPSKRGTCATCDGPVWLGATSRPNGRARCRKCSKRSIQIRIYIRRCPCGNVFSTRRPNQRFHSADCHDDFRRKRGFGPRRPRSSTERGYGREHQKAREAAAAIHHPEDPCARCGSPLGPMGPQLHYDHNDDRTAYLGFSHATCNSLDGARRGGRVARIGGGRCDDRLRIVA